MKNSRILKKCQNEQKAESNIWILFKTREYSKKYLLLLITQTRKIKIRNIILELELGIAITRTRPEYSVLAS